jgi:hypothetical protein
VLPHRPISELDCALVTLTSLARDDVPAACERLRALIAAREADVVVCDVAGVVADLEAVEVLARLRLTAQRLGCGLRLRGPSRGLEQLLAFCGLCDVLPLEGDLDRVRWHGGQAEEGKPTGGVEEGVEARDPPV